MKTTHPLVAIAESECARMVAARTGQPDMTGLLDLRQRDLHGRLVRFTTRAENRAIDRKLRRAKRLLRASRRASELAIALVASRA